MRHGCRILVAGAIFSIVVADVRGDSPTQVRSRIVDLEYRVNDEALPLKDVGIWYTRDRGQTWHFYGRDPDATPPVQFDAPDEGLYGFFLVLTNAAGVSSPNPAAGSEPHHHAFVDFTPPIVQLHNPAVTTRGASQLTLSIRWSAIDHHFPPRPVLLAYRTDGQSPWQTIGANLANTGRYDWPVPAGLTGKIELQVSVTDQGGNTGEALTSVELISAEPQPQVIEANLVSAKVELDEKQIDQVTRKRARKLHQQGLWYRDRGERKIAMARLRSALALDPSMTYALVDLADLLAIDGDIEAAEQAYTLLLQQDPNLRPALVGSASLAVKQRQYQQASDFLQRIVEHDPNDVESWLNLGDIAIYRGDELAARDYYQNAAKQDPTAKDVIARARLRLADIAGLTRQYRDANQAP